MIDFLVGLIQSLGRRDTKETAKKRLLEMTYLAHHSEIEMKTKNLKRDLDRLFQDSAYAPAYSVRVYDENEEFKPKFEVNIPL